MSVVQINGRIIIDGIELPPCPSKSKSVCSSIVGGKVYVNGYEFKDGSWKRTPMSLLRMLF